MGILSGKYFSLDGGPTDARLNLFKGLQFIVSNYPEAPSLQFILFKRNKDISKICSQHIIDNISGAIVVINREVF